MVIKIVDNYGWEFHLRFTLLNNVRRHTEAEIPTFNQSASIASLIALLAKSGSCFMR